MQLRNRCYIHCQGLFFDYWRFEKQFNNSHFDNEACFSREHKFISFRFEKKWLAYDSLYYDGHTVTSITLFGLTVSKGYSYDSRPVTKWTFEDLATFHGK